MLNQKSMKKWDIILLIIFPLFSVIVSLLITANFLTSTLLFFGLPAAWLSYRTKEMIKKTALFSLIFSIPFTIIIDYIAVHDKSWFVPETIFNFRLLGIIPIEDFVWGFLLVYTIIIFYEHFLNKSKHNLIDKRMKYFILPMICVLTIFFVLLLAKPEFLMIKYAYFWIGLILMLLPSIAFLSFFPKLASKYIKTATYFFALAFLFELTGLHLGQWTFPGTHFIGYIEILNIKFPLEEFFYWFVIGAIAILSYYEFFDDDRK
jgi:lycopene cyclase domain-containing protein